jgi:hypothetical protein
LIDPTREAIPAFIVELCCVVVDFAAFRFSGAQPEGGVAGRLMEGSLRVSQSN